MDLFTSRLPKKGMLYHNLISIINACGRVHQDRALLEFTDHGIGHSERIIDLLSRLCENSVLVKKGKDALNQHEVFILLSAIYLHDIGLQINNDMVLKSFSTEYGISYTESEKDQYIRDNHHYLSGFWINHNINEDKLLPDAYFGEKDLGHIVKIIVESHGLKFFEKEEYNEDYHYKGDIVRVKLLCVLLSVGDSLDCDCRRIDYDNLKYSQISNISKIHRMKHYYVNSINIRNGVVSVFYCFPAKIGDYEKQVYRIFFSDLNTKWIIQNMTQYMELLSQFSIAFNIDQNYEYSNTKDPLNDDQYSYIEEKVVDIIENTYMDGSKLPVPTMKISIGVLKTAGCVLMVKRRKKEGSLQWQFPAGIVKPSESPEQRAIAEFENETGITTTVNRVIGRRVHPDTNAICIYFALNYESGVIRNGDDSENSAAEWVSLQHYRDYITSNLYYKIIEYLSEE